MGNPVAPTMTTETRQAVPLTKPAAHQNGTTQASTDALFDSIAHEGIDTDETSLSSGWKATFTGLLWLGYIVAIAVAVVLIGAAVKEMLQ